MSPPPDSAAARRAATVRIAATALLLIAVLLPVRAKTVGFWLIPTLRDWRGQLPSAFASGAYDVWFVFATTAIALGLVWLPGRIRWLRPAVVFRAHLGFAAFTLLVGLANIAVVKWLGQPFTFQWLYYSDFLRSVDATMGMAEAVDWWQVAGGFVIAIVFGWVAARFGRWCVAHWRDKRWVRYAMTGAAGLALVIAVGGTRWLHAQGWGLGTVSNPIWSFAASFVRATQAPELFKMETPVGPDDFIAPAAPPEGMRASVLPADRPVPRNVIFFVLESVAARYVGLYGGEHGVTPELDQRREQAAIFQSAYAHAPATNMTLLSLVAGVYPRVSFRMTIAHLPGTRLPGLGNLLRARGYATAFFSSAPLEFQNADAFLLAQGDFDLVEDSRQRPPAAGATPPPWDARAGTDDATTVASLMQWIEARGEQPYFATLWTMQTHFPYFVAGSERPIVADEQYNRYLNALAESDRALGQLLAWLDETGRAADTVVVVLGDHGEAFGQHKNYGHAGQVFDENVRIPLVLLHPTLFSGQTHDTPAGVVDLAPTVTELLRLPPHAAWQGRSLFSTQRTGRVYFFAAWSDFLLGYREGSMKKVYNAATDRHVIFDVANDPGETRNLASVAVDGEASKVEITQRLAAWVQHSDRYYRSLLARD